MSEFWDEDARRLATLDPMAGYAGSGQRPMRSQEEYDEEQYRLERARRDAKKRADAEDGIVSTDSFDGAKTGGAWLYADDADVEPIWGTPDRTVWAAGEAMMIFAPQGTGKTTVAHQLIKGRIGLLDELLGLPIVEDPAGKVLLLSMDRPRQAKRAMKRLYRQEPPAARVVLDERLVVWEGPLPFEATAAPEALVRMAQHYGTTTVVVDSLKDVITKLSDDEAGSLWNRTVQMLLRAGIQVCILHHPRKASADNASRPKGVDDVFGSAWLTAGLGSIVSLWGKTGDLVLEFSMLKFVNAEVGPFKVEHDHEAGTTSIYDQVDLLGALVKRGSMTVSEAALLMFDATSPTPNEKQKARRALNRLVRAGQADEQEGTSGGAGGGTPARWTPKPGVTGNGGRIEVSDEFEAPRRGFGGSASAARPNLF